MDMDFEQLFHTYYMRVYSFVMAADSILLYTLIFVCSLNAGFGTYAKPAFFITTVCLLFPWGLFAVIRYLKRNRFTKSGICFVFGGIFFSFIHDMITWILDGRMEISLLDANLLFWDSDKVINANCYLLLLLSGGIIGGCLLLAGMFRPKNKAAKKEVENGGD